MADKPSKTPYLRFGEAERPIMGPAVEIVGNAKGLLHLRRQIDRALKDDDRYPLDDAIYRDEHEEEYQVVVRRAKSREEMRLPVPRVSRRRDRRGRRGRRWPRSRRRRVGSGSSGSTTKRDNWPGGYRAGDLVPFEEQATD